MELDWFGITAAVARERGDFIFFRRRIEYQTARGGWSSWECGEVLGRGWKCRRRKTDLRSGEEAGLREEEYRAEGEGARRRGGEERRKVGSARLQDGEEEVIQCLRGRGVEEKGERRRAEDGLARDRK